MDPTETLRQARTAIAAQDWEAAAILYMELDVFVSKGGFMPTPWMRKGL